MLRQPVHAMTIPVGAVVKSWLGKHQPRLSKSQANQQLELEPTPTSKFTKTTYIR